MKRRVESHVNSSSSSDDFAAFLDVELESASSDATLDDQENIGFEAKASKRCKVDTEATKELEGETAVEPTRGVTDTLPKLSDEVVCPHPGFWKHLCVGCGQEVEDAESRVSFRYMHEDLRLSSDEIERLRDADLRKLLQARKLILILDLDLTLVHSMPILQGTPIDTYLKRQAVSAQGSLSRSIFILDHSRMLTKLRPFVRTFLKEASGMFEMYIYTMGERPYADDIAKILDPDNVYFGSRLITRSDSTVPLKKGLDIVLGAENAILILDDTEDVWEERYKGNLIVMERYHFFASLVLQKRDESETGGALCIILNVLKRVHKMFFDPALGTDLSCRDVRDVLKSVRQEILQGCKIVFSRVFPSSGVSAEKQQIWKLAEQLGAVCSTIQDPSVTHVVSTDRGTEKARWAASNDKFLVTPQWIKAASFLWKRQPEDNFKVPSYSNAQRSSGQHVDPTAPGQVV